MTDLSIRTLQSPRFEGENLYYYEGDTFALLLPIELSREGVPVPIQPEDEIKITFFNRSGCLVTERTYTDIKDNTIEIDWDTEMTERFPKGSYTYRIRYNGERVQTVVADCRIFVQ